MSGAPADPPVPPHEPGRASTPVMPATEPQWPASLALVVGAILLLATPHHLQLGPSPYILSGLEALAAVFLLAGWPDRMNREREALRTLSIVIIAFTTVVNITSLVVLVRYLLRGGDVDGAELVRWALTIWGTNVIAFACWYWEVDGGGPFPRRDETIATRDFLFPQMTDDARPYAPRHWYPQFVDYLYVSFTNATAFSPTDTLPLSPRAKVLMAVQSTIALITIAVIGARAVNILH